MQARINNPAMMFPDAMQALMALAKSVEKSGLPKRTLDLIHCASLINGAACA